MLFFLVFNSNLLVTFGSNLIKFEKKSKYKKEDLNLKLNKKIKKMVTKNIEGDLKF